VSRLLKFIRGMIGMGLTFAAGVGGAFSMIVVLKWLLLGGDLGHDMIETVVTGAVPVGFLMGVAFSGGLALYGRSRMLAEMGPGGTDESNTRTSFVGAQMLPRCEDALGGVCCQCRRRSGAWGDGCADS